MYRSHVTLFSLFTPRIKILVNQSITRDTAVHVSKPCLILTVRYPPPTYVTWLFCACFTAGVFSAWALFYLLIKHYRKLSSDSLFLLFRKRVYRILFAMTCSLGQNEPIYKWQTCTRNRSKCLRTGHPCRGISGTVVESREDWWTFGHLLIISVYFFYLSSTGVWGLFCIDWWLFSVSRLAAPSKVNPHVFL